MHCGRRTGQNGMSTIYRRQSGPQSRIFTDQGRRVRSRMSTTGSWWLLISEREPKERFSMVEEAAHKVP